MTSLINDIKVISDDLDFDELQVLPNIYDRIKSIFYYSNKVDQLCSSQDFQKARWHFRSALSEFKSIFDVLPYDLRILQLDKIWHKSIFPQNLDNDVLIKILKKVRDLAVHSAHVKGDNRKFRFKLVDGDGEHAIVTETIFIDSINRVCL